MRNVPFSLADMDNGRIGEHICKQHKRCRKKRKRKIKLPLPTIFKAKVAQRYVVIAIWHKEKSRLRDFIPKRAAGKKSKTHQKRAERHHKIRAQQPHKRKHELILFYGGQGNKQEQVA